MFVKLRRVPQRMPLPRPSFDRLRGAKSKPAGAENGSNGDPFTPPAVEQPPDLHKDQIALLAVFVDQAHAALAAPDKAAQLRYPFSDYSDDAAALAQLATGYGTEQGDAPTVRALLTAAGAKTLAARHCVQALRAACIHLAPQLLPDRLLTALYELILCAAEISAEAPVLALIKELPEPRADLLVRIACLLDVMRGSGGSGLGFDDAALDTAWSPLFGTHASRLVTLLVAAMEQARQRAPAGRAEPTDRPPSFPRHRARALALALSPPPSSARSFPPRRAAFPSSRGPSRGRAAGRRATRP